MRKNIFHFLFLLAIALPLQAGADPVDAILGNWIAQENILGRDVQFQLGFSFAEDHMQLRVQCAYRDGQILEATASAAVIYNGNDISIQERNQGVVDDGFHFCRATLDRSQWSAYFDGTGKMVLFVPVPYQARLTLIRDI